jgi:hypothetical protein
MASPLPRNPARSQQKLTRVYHFPQTGVAAIGTYTADTNANMADADKVVLSDGFRTVTYEYDKSANGVVAGNVTWTAGTTAASVATNLKTAINANQPAFTVSDNLAGVLTITQRWPGAGGNVAITKTSSSAMAVTGMSGGVDPCGSVLADTTIKLDKVRASGRSRKIERAALNLPAGFTADATNFVTFKLLKGASTVIASWSTNTTGNGGQGTIGVNTFVEMVLSGTTANLYLADGDDLSLFIDVTGSPTVPPGVIVTEFVEL